ncbi:MAG: Gfo/Idh/MocA family oxidoreductase [Elusimicrobiota bacterium]
MSTTKTDKLKIGVVGCGSIANTDHLPTLSNHENYVLKAVADISDERLQKVKERFNIPATYNDYNELINKEDLDVLTVCTPGNLHYPVVMAALNKGLHVMSEKPLATELSEAKEMWSLAQKNGHILGVGMLYRGKTLTRRIKNHISNGDIGTLRTIRLITLSPGPMYGTKRREIHMNAEKGPIYDCGVHYFDLGRYLTDSEYDEIIARGIMVEGYKYPDHVIALAKFKNGVMGLIEESYIYGHRAKDRVNGNWRIEVEGSMGTISFDLENSRFIMRNDKVTLDEKMDWGKKPFPDIYTNFYEATKTGKYEHLASGDDGIKAMEAAEIALKSAMNNI